MAIRYYPPNYVFTKKFRVYDYGSTIRNYRLCDTLEEAVDLAEKVFRKNVEEVLSSPMPEIRACVCSKFEHSESFAEMRKKCRAHDSLKYYIYYHYGNTYNFVGIIEEFV